VIELLAAVVVRRTWTEHLDHDGRVHECMVVLDISLLGPTNDGNVRVRRQPGGQHANPKIGAIDSARATAKLNVERRAHIHREGSVLGRATGHGIYLPIEVLVLDVRVVLEQKVVAVAIGGPVPARGHRGEYSCRSKRRGNPQCTWIALTMAHRCPSPLPGSPSTASDGTAALFSPHATTSCSHPALQPHDRISRQSLVKSTVSP
jgi:hypothetical protein